MGLINLWDSGTVSSSFSDFFKNFNDFNSGAIEKKNIIYLISYTSWSYGFVVLTDSDVTFLGEGKDITIFPLLYSVLLISFQSYLHQIFQRYFVKASRFSGILEVFFLRYCVKFFPCKLSKFDVSLIFHDFFDRSVFDFKRFTGNIHEMFFPLLKSFFMAGSV